MRDQLEKIYQKNNAVGFTIYTKEDGSGSADFMIGDVDWVMGSGVHTVQSHDDIHRLLLTILTFSKLCEESHNFSVHMAERTSDLKNVLKQIVNSPHVKAEIKERIKKSGVKLHESIRNKRNPS